MNTYTETQVANIISMVANLITSKPGLEYEEAYKWLIKNKSIGNKLASHIMTVVQSCRKTN